MRPFDSTSWVSPQTSTGRQYSTTIPPESPLSSINAQLLRERFDALTWTNMTQRVPSAVSQASSTFWLGTVSSTDVEWEEWFLAPFRPNRTVKVTMRMRYVGPLQPEHLSLEYDWLD